MNLSVVIIAKNEASNIEDCLKSVDFADERIVLDGGSTDNTAELASSMGAKVFNASQWHGFGHQKNLALTHASGQWVLSLDADERVTPALQLEILDAIQHSPNTVFEIPRQTNFCGKWIHHCGWTPDFVARLFQNGQARFSLDQVHEKLVYSSLPVQKLTQPLLHFSYPTTAHYWKKLQTYSDAWAIQQYQAGRTTTMTRAVLSAMTAFIKSYFVRLGFLDGAMGFAVCFMQAQAAFGKYFSLYCLNQSKHD